MFSTRLAVIVLAAAPLAVAACGGSKGGAVGDAKLPEGSGAKALDHEECSESGNRVEVLDTNGDGKPDVRRIYGKGSGREICRISDLNHDGKPDLFEYYDDGANVRRREYCYDDTGVVNAVEYFEGGKLVRREYDTTGQHKVDTWDWFEAGLPVDDKSGRPLHPSRRERDTTGDGKVDQWWTWSGDNVTIASDVTGDGKPDPSSSVTLGKDGHVVDTSGGASGSGGAPAASSSAAPAASSAAPAASSSAAPAAPPASADGGAS